MKESLFLYRKLEFLGKYHFKILFVAFVGIHIPLISLTSYFWITSGFADVFQHVILLTLLATLAATGVTLYVLEHLLRPIHLLRTSLDQYIKDHQLPALPTHFQDEIGLLMSDIQKTLEGTNQLVEEKNDMIGILSHDLRSPVSQVYGLVQLMETEIEEDHPHQHYLQLTKDLCDQHSNILMNMLDLLKQQESISESMFEEIELGKLIEDGIKANLTAISKKNITIELNPHDQTQKLRAEPTLLRQAVQNIIQNAIKFSHPEGVIHIVSHCREDNITVTITDQGIGFSPEIAEKMFDRFTKAGRKGTLKEPSTGLGLFLTKKVIHNHQGTIVATSPGENKGATFTITIPTHISNLPTPIMETEL